MLSGLLPICRPVCGRGMLTSPFRVRQMSLSSTAQGPGCQGSSTPGTQSAHRPGQRFECQTASLNAHRIFYRHSADCSKTATPWRNKATYMLYFALITRRTPEKHYSTQKFCSSLAYCIKRWHRDCFEQNNSCTALRLGPWQLWRQPWCILPVLLCQSDGTVTDGSHKVRQN